MRAASIVVAALVAACGTEPVRPMAPELDPASPRAPLPAYRPADNPLAGEVPAHPMPDASGEAPSDPHSHHHHGHTPSPSQEHQLPAPAGEGGGGGGGG